MEKIQRILNNKKENWLSMVVDIIIEIRIHKRYLYELCI